jgi:hypothetical protein
MITWLRDVKNGGCTDVFTESFEGHIFTGCDRFFVQFHSSSAFSHDQSDPQSVVLDCTLDKVGSFPQVIRCSPELGRQGSGLRPEVLPI